MLWCYELSRRVHSYRFGSDFPDDPIENVAFLRFRLKQKSRHDPKSENVRF